MYIQGKYRCTNCFNELHSEDEKCVCGFDEHSYQTAPHHLKPGTIINNSYCIGRVLGEGGFGITYMGFDMNLEMKIAIKEFFLSGYSSRTNTVSNEVSIPYGPNRKVHEANRDKFVIEARILAKFNTEEGVVNVHGFFEANNTAYIIMEYLDGKNLKEYLKTKGRMSVDEVMEIFIPIMRTLDKVHLEQLIHRDISPDNIIFTQNGKVKLLDFGAAKKNSDGTESLTVVLKPGFAPIEQYQSHGKQGAWTDVYALSATIYRCLTGVNPSPASDRATGEEVKTINTLVDGCPKEFSDVIERGLAFNYVDRYQSMGEFASALSTAYEKYCNQPATCNADKQALLTTQNESEKEPFTVSLGWDDEGRNSDKIETSVEKKLDDDLVLTVEQHCDSGGENCDSGHINDDYDSDLESIRDGKESGSENAHNDVTDSNKKTEAKSGKKRNIMICAFAGLGLVIAIACVALATGRNIITDEVPNTNVKIDNGDISIVAASEEEIVGEISGGSSNEIEPSNKVFEDVVEVKIVDDGEVLKEGSDMIYIDEEHAGYGFVSVTSNVRLRSTPDSGNKTNILATAKEGSTFISLGDYNEEWTKVRYDGREAYIASEFLVVTSSARYSETQILMHLLNKAGVTKGEYSYKIAQNGSDGCFVLLSYRSDFEQSNINNVEWDGEAYAKGVTELWFISNNYRCNKIESYNITNYCVSRPEKNLSDCDINVVNFEDAHYLYTKVIACVDEGAEQLEAEEKIFNLSDRSFSSVEKATGKWNKVEINGYTYYISGEKAVNERLYKDWDNLIASINDKFATNINALEGCYEDYDGDGKYELFVPVRSESGSYIDVFFANNSEAKKVGSFFSESADLVDKGCSLKGEIYTFNECNTKAMYVKSYNMYYLSGTAYTVMKDGPAEIRLKDNDSISEYRLVNKNGQNYIAAVEKMHYIDNANTIRELTADYVLYPVTISDGYFEQIESQPVSMEDFLSDGNIAKILPRIESRLKLIQEYDFAGEYEGQDFGIKVKDVALNSVLYNPTGYYIVNYSCTCDIAEDNSQNNLGTEFHAIIENKNGTYIVTEVGDCHVKSKHILDVDWDYR